MDRNRFDALTRLLGREGSRRAALGAAFSAAILGNGLSAGAKKKNKKKKKKPQTCFGTLECEFPGPALDFENCNFSGQNVCEGTDCSGSNFRRADLSDTEMDFGNFQGASFRDACLVGASFFGANVDGADFEGAIFCNTTLSDGTIDDSDCEDATACCPSCIAGAICNGSCCEFPCECIAAVPGPGVVCVDLDVGACNCPCDKDPDCPDDWVCVDDGFCGFVHRHPLCGAVIEERSANRSRSHRG